MENQHHPQRKNFQIDRMILFTDAVFAIAITLLVIDIKVPIIGKNGTEEDFVNALIGQIPKLFAFIVSFFIIGLYWFLHHKMFGYVINYTSKLIRLNLIFLFSIVLLPFTTSVYSGYSTEEHIHLIGPYALYASNLCFTGVMQFVLLKYIYNPKNAVSSELPSRENQKSTLYRALAIPAIFLASLLLTVVTPLYGRMLLFTIPIFMRLLGPKKAKISEEKEANT